MPSSESVLSAGADAGLFNPSFDPDEDLAALAPWAGVAVVAGEGPLCSDTVEKLQFPIARSLSAAPSSIAL